MQRSSGARGRGGLHAKLRTLWVLGLVGFLGCGLSTAAHAVSAWYYGDGVLYSSLGTWVGRYSRAGYDAWRYRDCNATSTICSTDGHRISDGEWIYAGVILRSECGAAQVLGPSGVNAPRGDVVCTAQCPSGHSANVDGVCRPTADRCAASRNPVVLPSGSRERVEEDYLGAGPFPLRFARAYTTHAGYAPPVGTAEPDLIGVLWRSSLEYRAYPGSGSVLASVYRPDGEVKDFDLAGLEIGGCEPA